MTIRKTFAKAVAAFGIAAAVAVAAPAVASADSYNFDLGATDEINIGDEVCSIGAFGKIDSDYYILTAGHCAAAPRMDVTDGQGDKVGTVVAKRDDHFEGAKEDENYGYTLIKVTEYGRLNFDWKSMRNPVVGESARIKGATTTTERVGTVTGVDTTSEFIDKARATLDFPSQGGDSGSGVFTHDSNGDLVLLGLVIGHDGDVGVFFPIEQAVKLVKTDFPDFKIVLSE